VSEYLPVSRSEPERVAAIGFRNVLAHEYGQVDTDEVYETLQTGIAVYDAYSWQVARWMQSQTE
jgi:uncharacterized protein YutE (UPF0331/DUF86 family)